MSTVVIKSTVLVKWKQIPNFPNFYVSNNGLLRKGSSLMHPKAKTRCGRLWVWLRGGTGELTDGRFDVHFLVWMAFDGRKPSKDTHIHHKDLDFKNNNIDNLELLSAKEHKRLHCAIRNHTNKAA